MQRHIAFRLLISFFIVALVIPTVYAAPRGTVSQILSIAGEVEDARSVRDEVRNLKTRIASFNKRLKNAAKVKKLKVRRALEREVKRELTLLRRELKVLERELRLEARTRALKARSAKTPRASVPPQTPGAARIDELLKNGAGESGKVPPGLLT
ncbi:hypothetical protein HY629_02860, partial [Candidatus Uhrbacteria bacterium]|nr:hypothetical protein [Candidatus Uhrbacteria bacterium]